ncbi:hypothetical protein NKG94_17415 [Micromonospora sp. M12]
MSDLTDDELHLAAHDFLTVGMPTDLRSELVAPMSTLPKECTEAQNTKKAAENAADHMLVYANAVDRLLKFGLKEYGRSKPHPDSQDLYRAAIMFAGAGLDRALKALVSDALPALARIDKPVQERLTAFAESAIADAGGWESAQPR